MDTENKQETIEKESLVLVLEEFTEEHKNNAKLTSDLVTAVNGLINRVNQLEGKLQNPNLISVSADTRPMQEILKKGIIDMKLIVAAQPKNVIRKFQLLLFPEQDSKLFYKIVFGRWFLWLAITLLLTNLYRFSIHWSDNQKEIKAWQLENDRLKRAWNYLYSNQGKDIKRLMDSAFLKNSYDRTKK